ncbi:MAG: ParB/RepB/Spo0J family partition protein [Acidobacteriota bacterium]|nr:ParB/RepB/Spo0J family partition protein [Acidobacteriota bacterium]
MARKVGLPDFVKSKYDNHFVDEISQRTRTTIIRNIPLEKLTANVLQPRKDFGDLTELSESIKEKGILEPVLVRPKDGQFEIVAGERRYRAAKLAGLTEIPCIEYDVPDNEALELSIIENIQRKDLDIYEQSYSLKSLSEVYGYTHQEIAQKIGKSRVTVTELIRITDLPPNVLQQCMELNIASKTFLLELVKLEDVDEMLEVLKDYSDKPFSREKIKKKRKGEEEAGEKPVSGSGSGSGLKFQFITEDKAVKIKFDIKSKDTDKNKIIEILEKLIIDLREDKINLNSPNP